MTLRDRMGLLGCLHPVGLDDFRGSFPTWHILEFSDPGSKSFAWFLSLPGNSQVLGLIWLLHG